MRSSAAIKSDVFGSNGARSGVHRAQCGLGSPAPPSVGCCDFSALDAGIADLSRGEAAAFLAGLLRTERELVDCPQIELAAREVRDFAGLHDLFRNP